MTLSTFTYIEMLRGGNSYNQHEKLFLGVFDVKESISVVKVPNFPPHHRQTAVTVPIVTLIRNNSPLRPRFSETTWNFIPPWKTSFQENWPLDPENGKRPNVDNSTLFLLRLYISERNFSAFHFPLVVWEKKMFLLFPISITHFLVSPQTYFEWDLSIFLLFAFCVQLQYQMSKLRADKQYFCVSCYFLGFQKVYEYISLWNSAWSSATVPLKRCQYLISAPGFENVINRFIT